MIDLATGRRAIIRDLDATDSQLRSLPPSWRERMTPCEGWEVRHLAAHLVESTRRLSHGLMDGISKRTGAENRSEPAGEANPDADWNVMMARLTYGRNQMVEVLDRLTMDDLDPPGSDPDTVDRMRRLFTIAVLEFGIHRFDLEAAMDREPGVDVETVEATDRIYGQHLAQKAADSMPDGPHTDPFALHLQGDNLLDRWLVWNGTAWTMTRDDEPVTRIAGSDSTITLFMMGRIRADDHRLQLEGDRDIAKRFKTFVPGP